MCTYITEKTEIDGNGKGHGNWLHLSHANVYYDHPSHAPMDHALAIDFVNETQGPGARVAIEMSAESAHELSRGIYTALGISGDDKIVRDPIMSPSIITTANIFGSGKGPKGWFAIHKANICYDNPQHTNLPNTLNMEFINDDYGLDTKIAVELSADSARRVVGKIQIILESDEAKQLQ